MAYDHIVVVWEENKNYNDIVGNPRADFLNQVAQQGKLYTNFYALSLAASQANYVGAYAGDLYGVNSNTNYTLSGTTLADQLAAAGLEFVGWDDAAPRKHKPWVSFGDPVQKSFAGFPTTEAGLDALPEVSWIIPNDHHNMHNIPAGGTSYQDAIAAGDDWAQQNLSGLVQWAKDPSNNALVVFTFDEDRAGTAGNHIFTAAVGAGITPGSTDGTRHDLYDLLRTTEANFNLPFLLNAANGTTMNIGTAGGTGGNPTDPTPTPGPTTQTGTTAADNLVGTAGDDDIAGRGGNDTLDGAAGNDILKGEGGSDSVLGGDGDDVITGGAGTNTVAGGAGADDFTFLSRTGQDVITDFVPGTDDVLIDASGFGGGLVVGPVSAAQFTTNNSGQATASGHRLTFEADAKKLWFDADGNGAGTRDLVATLSNGATLTVSDVEVIA
jgi:Ca2+-binding RTX toxin-like protein